MLKVATPATAFTLTVPPSDAPAGPEAMVALTAPVKPVCTVPSAFFALTTMEGASVTPATCVVAGPVLTASALLLPPVAVALTVSVPRPVADTDNVWTPSTPPSVHSALAVPDASVVTLVGRTEPPPLATLSVSAMPPMPLPRASRT